MRAIGIGLLLGAAILVVLPGARSAGEPLPALRFDPFAIPASPNPKQAGGLAAVGDADWMPILRATLVAGADSMADLGGDVLAIGGETHGYRLLEVRPFEAVFAKDGERIVLPVQRDLEGAKP